LIGYGSTQQGDLIVKISCCLGALIASHDDSPAISLLQAVQRQTQM
jgi:hypothetical protein